MRTILCFGDSNTWGYDPDLTATSPIPVRFPPEQRWTGVMARDLGNDYRVIEEGQNGRTTVWEDQLTPHRNGRIYLPACLESHKPIDIVVLMLGTNDLKTMFHVPPGDIAAGVGVLVRMILASDAGLNGLAPRVLLVCPPAIGDLSGLPELNAKLERGREKSLALPNYYHSLANTLGVDFFNTQSLVIPSKVDGIHLDGFEHINLGKALAVAVRNMG